MTTSHPNSSTALDRFTSVGLHPVNPGTIGQDLYRAPTATRLRSISPIDGQSLAEVEITSVQQYEQVVNDLHRSFLSWRTVPAPKRGEVVRCIGDELRKNKRVLGELVSCEMGKIRAEGEGEIQEAIDVADFAVGLSRQLYGYAMHSERPGHRMYEQWHPLGVVGVITAFNFPAAVWAWNAMIAAVCGNTVLWKPSPETPLTAVALTEIVRQVCVNLGYPNIFGLVVDQGKELGERLSNDRRIPLVSATGSCEMGRSVAQATAARLGRSLLELGGNNAIIVMDDAPLDLATRSIVFGAVGTAGQRCTTTRRLFMQRGISAELLQRLQKIYAQIPIGNPLDDGILMGPLINSRAVDGYLHAVKEIQDQGGSILFGGQRVLGLPSPLYVQPTLVQCRSDLPIVQRETFAPILYCMEFETIDEAITLQNSVPQGLSSAIFTSSLQSAELFLSARGSDCGIANVNIGTSGAEIGGAFGGEKESGGGRESGSDSWRQYMRRQTVTINYSDTLPLAQGIRFEV